MMIRATKVSIFNAKFYLCRIQNLVLAGRKANDSFALVIGFPRFQS